MNLQTERIVLRRIEENDMPEMIDMLTNAAIKQTYMIPDFSTEEEVIRLARRFIDCSHVASRVDVGLDLDGRLIGFINDVGIGAGEIELGYALHPDYWGSGYMTEALKALIGELFRQGYCRIVAGAFAENQASIRVMEKCGMQKIKKSDRIEYRGKMHDCVYYAIECGEKR